MNASIVTHRGGCHCGSVKFEVDAPPRLQVLECNCSICRMTAFLHLIVPTARFRLISGRDVLREYTFNSGVARHYFCATCGIKSFYVPRSHPDGIDVNVRCLDSKSIEAIDVAPFDDADRERVTASLRHLSQ